MKDLELIIFDMDGRCLVLDDSETGILAANQAGMRSIMVPDIKEPSESILKLCWKRMNSLQEVRTYLEPYLK